MKDLEKAIESAGLELEREHGFELLRREGESVVSTRFGQIIMKHVGHVVAPFFDDAARQARIAELRVELDSLARVARGSPTVEIRPFSEFSPNMLPCLIGDGEDWLWAVEYGASDDGDDIYLDPSHRYFSAEIVRYFAIMPVLPTTD